MSLFITRSWRSLILCFVLIAAALAAAQSAAAQVTNSPPVGLPDSYALNEDVSLQVSATAGVLANDFDPDGNPLEAILQSGSGPQNGTLVLNGDGSFVYTPTGNFHGSDTFLYLASDSIDFSDPIAVTLEVASVNDPPTAEPIAAATDEDQWIGINLLGSDPDAGDTLAYLIATEPGKGTLSGSGATRIYTPDANVNGVDSFDYYVFDGTQNSPAATVTITIHPVNDRPAAISDSIEVQEDSTAVTITLRGEDIDDDSLSYAISAEPNSGTLSGTGNKRFYTPAANYFGVDGFQFTVTDGISVSLPAAVAINVTPQQDPPETDPVPVQVSEDSSVQITLVGADPDNDPLTFTVVAGSGPEHGTLSEINDKKLTYTPNLNYFGSDQFEFSVTDGHVSVPVTDTVSIEVQPIPDAPSRLWLEGNTIAENLSPGTRVGFLRAEDPDLLPGMTQVYTFTLVDSQTYADNNLFRVVGNQLRTDGFLDYEDPEHIPQATIQVQAADPTGLTRLAQFTIQILDQNEPPTSLSDPYTMVYGEVLHPQPKNGVLSNDNDPDGDPLGAMLVEGPAHSKSFILYPDGSFNYEPETGYLGVDQFTYRASDGELISEVTDVEIFVADKTDPTASWVGPVEDGQVYTVVGHQVIELTVDATDDIGVSRVRFYRWAFRDPLDPQTGYSLDIAIDETNPFQAELESRELHPEWNQIFVKSFDTSGNESGRTWIWIYYLPPHLLYLPQISQ